LRGFPEVYAALTARPFSGRPSRCRNRAASRRAEQTTQMRLDKAFGGGVETWLRLQMAYNPMTLPQAHQLKVKSVRRSKLQEPRPKLTPHPLRPRSSMSITEIPAI
jgi:hypothetical protein